MNTFENILEERLAGIGAWLRPERVFLACLGMFGGIAIVLLNTGVFPLAPPYAIFYLLLLFLFGLYRPEFLWYTVVFLLPFETLTVAMFGRSIDIRGYQMGMVALGAAVAVLLLQGNRVLPKLRWFDGALALLLVGAILTFVFRQLPFASAKEIIILASFGLLYGLGRIFIRKKSDAEQFLATLLVSGVVVAGYALWQMVLFQTGGNHFMVMPGRPNSVLPEADWLGFFMGMVGLVALIAFLKAKEWYQEICFAVLTLLFLVALIITVSRSAWLAFAVGGVVLGLLLGVEFVSGFIHSQLKNIKTLFKFFLGVPVLLVLAVTIVLLTHLTRFELDERLASTGGQQLVTAACTAEVDPPKEVASLDELSVYGCQHINLEEQAWYESQGYVIAEVSRPDPNVSIRKSLYQQTWNILKDHFFLGLGWGESLKVFGTDGRGAGLNSSNVFLEVWLGSGLIGLWGFLFFWLGILFALGNRLVHKREMTEGFWWSALLLALWFQVTVFNLFNAGLLLGVFLVFLMLASWYGEKTLPYGISSLWQK